MSVITEFTLSTDEFVLSRSLSTHEDVEVELEQVVPASAGPFPYLVARGPGDVPSFERAARDDPAIERLVAVDSLDAGVRYRVEWSGERTGFTRCLDDTGAALLDGHATHGRWNLEVRFPDGESLAAFQRGLDAEGVDPDVRRVYTPNTLESRGVDLTPVQRRTIVAAFEAGYFEEPRSVTLGELAERLGVSDGAVAGRLRRGLLRVVTDVVVGE